MVTQLLRELHDRLNAPTRGALQQAISLAKQRGLDLYLVGGSVRDLLLRSPQLDIDLVIEGDGVAFTASLAPRLGARATSHPRFGTATVAADGYRLDIAGARTESYPRPGALPAVAPATLADDLARRDFTINAMALPLTDWNHQSLIDLHGGREDLKDGLLRVLHERSFQDDPTRILRAARYAGRLGFRLEEETKRRLRRGLGCLDTVSGVRLRHELERIAAEDAPGVISRLAGEMGVLSAIHTDLCVSGRQVKAMTQLAADASAVRRVVMFLAVLLADVSTRQTEALISRLSLTCRQSAAVRGIVALRPKEGRLGIGAVSASEVVSTLSDSPPEAVEALAALSDNPAVRERLRRYLDEWRFVRPRLNGSDIEALGVPHGPKVGAALDALRVARLDGAIATREDEVMFVRRLRGRSRARAGSPRG